MELSVKSEFRDEERGAISMLINKSALRRKGAAGGGTGPTVTGGAVAGGEEKEVEGERAEGGEGE